MTDNFISFAKSLRKRATDAENLLWKYLRSKQLEGLKFRRQEPIGNYIVDFVCFEKRMVIEIDGGQHAIETNKDYERDKWFKKQGFNVLRFWNNEVLENIDGVLEVIRDGCLSSPSPNPSHQGRGIEKERLLSREGKKEEKKSTRACGSLKEDKNLSPSP